MLPSGGEHEHNRLDVAAIARVAFTSEDRARDVIRNFNADGFGSLYPKYRGGRPAYPGRDEGRRGKSSLASDGASRRKAETSTQYPDLPRYVCLLAWCMWFPRSGRPGSGAAGLAGRVL